MNKVDDKTRVKHVLPASNKNGGEFAAVQNKESALSLAAMGIKNEHDLAQAMYDHCTVKVSKMMNNASIRNKNSSVNEDDILSESAISLIKAYRTGKLEGVENLIGYMTSVVRNTTMAKTAISSSPTDYRARKDLDTITEMYEEVIGEPLTAELREEFTRKVRGSFDGESHRPSKNYHLPATVTFSLDASSAAADGGLQGGDIATGALLSRGELYENGSIAAATQPELQTMNRLGNLEYALESEADLNDQMDQLALLASDRIETSDRQMAGVLKRQYFEIISKKYNLPSTEGVAIPQGVATRYRGLLDTPQDLIDACNSWSHAEWDAEGNLPANANAFFAPWGETTEDEKDRLVDYFTKGLKNPENALKMWQTVIASVNTMQAKRDKKYIANAKAKSDAVSAGGR